MFDVGCLCTCICTTTHFRLATERREVLLISAPRPAAGVALNLWKLLSCPPTAEGHQRGTEVQGFRPYRAFPFLLSAVPKKLSRGAGTCARERAEAAGDEGGAPRGVGTCIKWGKAWKRRGETEGRKWKRRKRNDVQEEADAIRKITSRDLKK